MARVLRSRLSKWMLVCIVIGTPIGVLRDEILAHIAKMYISNFLAKQGWELGSIETRGNCVLLAHAHTPDMTIEHLEIKCLSSLYPPFFKPELTLFEPFVCVKTGGESWNPLPLIVGNTFFRPAFIMKKGTLFFPQADVFLRFEFQDDQLQIYQDSSVEQLASISIERDLEGIVLKGELRGGSVDLLIPSLLEVTSDTALLCKNGWDSLTGTADASWLCYFSPNGQMMGVDAQISLEGIDVKNSTLDFSMQSKTLKGTFSLFPQEPFQFLKQADLFLTFEESSLLLSHNGCTFGFKDSMGEVRLHPGEDPYLRMLGKSISMGTSIPFSLEGKGELLENGAYWLQADLDFFLQKQQPHLSLSLCQNEKEEGTVQVDFRQIIPEIGGLIQVATSFCHCPDWHMDEGQLQGKLLAKFHKNTILSLELSDFLARNLTFVLPAQDLFCKVHEVAFQGFFGGDLRLESCDMEVHRADLAIRDLHFVEIASRIRLVEGVFEPSYLEGSYRGIKTSLQLLPEASGKLLHLECGAYPNDLLHWIFSEKASKVHAGPIFLALDIQEEGERTGFSGMACFSSADPGEGDLEFEGHLDKKLSRSFADLATSWNVDSCQLNFHMDALSWKTVRPYWAELPKEWEGNCKLKGSVNKKGAEFFLGDVQIVDAKQGMFCRLGTENPVRLCYTWSLGQWEGFFPITELLFDEKAISFPMKFYETVVYWKDSRFWTDKWKMQSGDSMASGEGSFDGTTAQLKMDTIRTSMETLTPLLNKHLPGIAWNRMKGRLSGAQEGSLLTAIKKGESWEYSWSIHTLLDKFCYSEDSWGVVEEGEGKISLNSLQEVSIRDMRALYRYGSLTCYANLGDLVWNPISGAEFSLGLKEEMRELLALEGRIDQHAVVHFYPGTHLLGIDLQIAPIALKGAAPIIATEFTLDLERAPSYYRMGKNLSLFPDLELPKLQGNLKVKMAWDIQSDCLDLQCNSSDFSWNQTSLGTVLCHVKKNKDSWEMFPSSIGPYVAECKIERKEIQWRCPSLSITAPHFIFTAKGGYLQDRRRISCSDFSLHYRGKDSEVRSRGNFEGSWNGILEGKGLCRIALAISGTTPVIAQTVKDGTFSWNGHLVTLGDSSWECTAALDKQVLAGGKVDKLQWDGNKIILCGGDFQIKSALLPKEVSSLQIQKDLSVQMEGEWTPEFYKFSGALKGGNHTVAGMHLDVKQTRFLFEPGELYLFCHAFLEKEPFWLQLQHRGSRITGLLKDHPDSIGMNFVLSKDNRGDWNLDAVKGTFYGVDLAMQRREGKEYETELTLDLGKLPAISKKYLTIPASLGLGSGYSYRGKTFLSQGKIELSGEVSAKKFGFLGRNWDSLKAQVRIGKNGGSIQGVTLEDEIGSLQIKMIELNKVAGTDSWQLSIPIIHVRDFIPSLLTKGKKEGVLIRNFSLYNILGEIAPKEKWWETLTGNGLVQIMPLTQKEASFWDAPLGLLKDLGLDPRILTPVTGEADLMLAEGKIHFTALHNVFSEAERSQFDLADMQDAYLSLDGDWHLDLQMRQNVLLKVTEGLVLSVRGTLVKPKYSVRLKNSP